MSLNEDLISMKHDYMKYQSLVNFGCGTQVTRRRRHTMDYRKIHKRCNCKFYHNCTYTLILPRPSTSSGRPRHWHHDVDDCQLASVKRTDASDGTVIWDKRDLELDRLSHRHGNKRTEHDLGDVALIKPLRHLLFHIQSTQGLVIQQVSLHRMTR